MPMNYNWGQSGLALAQQAQADAQFEANHRQYGYNKERGEHIQLCKEETVKHRHGYSPGYFLFSLFVTHL